MIEPQLIFFSELNNNFSILWNSLLEPSGLPTFQYDFEYISAWCKYLRNKWNPFILIIKENNKNIGIFPLMYLDLKRRNILPTRIIRFLAHTKTDFSVILAENKNINKVVEESLKWLFYCNLRWEILILDDIAEDNPIFLPIKNWLDIQKKAYDLKIGKYYYIDLNNSWEEIRIGMSKKAVRRSINLAKNRITKAGSWNIVSDPNWGTEVIIDEASKIHIARQKMLGRESLFSRKEEKKFLKTIIEHFRNQGIFRSHWLQFNKKNIAYMIGFVQHNVYYAWNMAFHPNYSFFFPSKLLIYNIIKECYEKKIKEFNFMRGESYYKSDWAKQTRTNNRFIIKNTKSIYGKIGHFTDRFVR